MTSAGVEPAGLEEPSSREADRVDRVALVFGVPAGLGGLGLQVASALEALAGVARTVYAVGPGFAPGWLPRAGEGQVVTCPSPAEVSGWSSRWTWLRWRQGRRQWLADTRLGGRAAAVVAGLRPDLCYVFTQVGLEVLRWAAAAGVPSILDNPNGHIRGYRDVYVREAAALTGRPYLGHPTERMVARVAAEYALAGRVRVSSTWARDSMAAHGVPAHKVVVAAQPLDTARFRPAPLLPPDGPLRVCFVGSLDLRKGFAYLLRAVRRVGPGRVAVRLVGGTGDPWCRSLLARETAGLDCAVCPGDPVPAYRWAELVVLPSLEDGFGFVAAEALACGRPVVVTRECGAAELVNPGVNGWVVPAGDVGAIAGVFETALRDRALLAGMAAAAPGSVARHQPGLATAEFRTRLFPGLEPGGRPDQDNTGHPS